jgi:hypothetical protein
MKKYIIAIAGTLFFVGLIALAANLSSSDSEIDLFYNDSSYGSRDYVYSNYSNSSFNYSRHNYKNSTSYNASNRSSYAVPGPFYGSTNLTVRLPAQNISLGNISIYVYNATFYGNSTSSDNFIGRVYAKFNLNALVNSGWYGYYVYFYDQDVIYDAFSSYSCNEYYNESLISNKSALRTILFNYYWGYAKPAIASAISNSSSNTTNTTQYLPSALIRAENLTSWYNASWWTFNNYSSVGYFVNIWNANFTGTVGKYNTSGRIRVTFDAYGNNSYTPSYNQSQTYESRVGATIDVYNSWVSSITFDRQLAIFPSDLRNFLKPWVTYQAIPYLVKNSSNTTGLVFPEYNITGFDLNNWIQQYNAYPNYTWPGYYVYVYNSSHSLRQSNNTVYGNVYFSLIAFGNDTAYPQWNRSKITVYSNASMYVYVDGDQRNNTQAWYYVDYNLRVNYTDVYNFLRGYFYGVMVPNITSYYNLTNSTTPNRTIYLPNYYNSSQLSIDCSQQYWYCSGAQPQSSLFFLGTRGYNLSITVDQRGNGYFNGALNLPYIANLINSTSTYYGKETIVDNVQGNATIYLFGWVSGTGNNSYYVTLDTYAYVNVVFDRNYFVQNAAQRHYADTLRYYLQYFVNNILSNGTRNYYY